MKFKLDENLGRREAEVLRTVGHDVKTVFEQNVCSVSDHSLIELCRAEERCLVTLDIDFGNPLVFKPSQYKGIAVLRLGRRIRSDDIQAGLRTLLSGLDQDSIDGKLWIVQRARIRVYQEESNEEERPPDQTSNS